MIFLFVVCSGMKDLASSLHLQKGPASKNRTVNID